MAWSFPKAFDKLVIEGPYLFSTVVNMHWRRSVIEDYPDEEVISDRARTKTVQKLAKKKLKTTTKLTLHISPR